MSPSKFFRGFTPLLSSPDVVRAARIYPGGANLDRLVGAKTKRESGWHYPEAWVFSPSAAINPGSARTDEGQTVVYDRQGETCTWGEYVERHGDEVLGGGEMDITVKLLDGAVTLPKEFHFRDENEARLREFPRLEEYSGTLIKPEVWIRHPGGTDDASPAYFGFREEMNAARLATLVGEGGNSIEEVMNEIHFDPGDALYVPGGVVHSLGKGLYFEVLADGDLRVTLADEFAGRALSVEERLDALYRDGDATIDSAFEFIDYGPHDVDFVARCRTHDRESVDTPYFSARWLRVPPGERREFEGGRPHVLVCALGAGRLQAGVALVHFSTRASGFEEFAKHGSCYAGVVHASTHEYVVENNGTGELRLLAAFGATSRQG